MYDQPENQDKKNEVQEQVSHYFALQNNDASFENPISRNWIRMMAKENTIDGKFA